MSELTEFLKSKVFFKNVAFAIVLVVVFFGSASLFLSHYTRHGQFSTLPDLSKMQLAKAEDMLKDMGLNYVIIDSEFDEKLPPHIIINQNPYAGAHVKNGRNIYLYITSSVPPQVEMPNLVDKSLRQAKGMLANNGLKLGSISYQTDQCVDCILKQLYRGKVIAPSAMIPKGSVIDLIVGKGLNGAIDTTR
jgi:beta-lactam-binding protein with PASTA domain